MLLSYDYLNLNSMNDKLIIEDCLEWRKTWKEKTLLIISISLLNINLKTEVGNLGNSFKEHFSAEIMNLAIAGLLYSLYSQ